MPSPNKSFVKVAVWNLHSLQNKFAESMEHIIDYSTDFAFISETWLTTPTNDVTAYMITRGYTFHHAVRLDSVKKRGGGVGILCRSKYKLTKLKSAKYQSFEHCIYSVRKHKYDRMVLVAIYRLGHVAISEFWNEFPSFLETLCSMNCLLLMGGDINIHLDVKTDSQTKSFNDILDSFNLFQMVNEITHREGHLLDILICNEPDKCQNVEVLDCALSDHFMVRAMVDFCPNTISEYKMIHYRKLKNINRDSFRSDLIQNFASDQLLDQADFGYTINMYNKTLKDTLDKHAPLITKVVKIVTRAPWFDNEYVELRRKRRKAEKLFRQTKLMIHKTNFVNLRKQTTLLAKSKKISHCRAQINESDGSTKSLFKTFNKLIGKTNEAVYPTANSDAEVANQFASFFTNKVKSIRENMQYMPNNLNVNTSNPITSTSTTYRNGFTYLHQFELTTEEEILGIINESGIICCFSDPLPDVILENNVSLFLPIWTHIVNMSLQQSSMDNLKLTDIKPFLKDLGLDTEEHKNFRPVSNLQFLGKLIERVVLKRLNSHLTQNNLHISNQYGYKKGHSTESILVKISNDILIASDQKTATVLLLLDLSAAFDTVDVKVLINILFEEIGIRGSALQWFKAFLMNRSMRVKINNSFSEIFVLEFGIPQGSVLGPVLFNIYIRSIYKHVENCGFNIKGFADDHQLYVSFSPSFQYHYLGEKINEILNLVTKWTNTYFLKLNPSKTQIIVFGPKAIQDSLLIHGTFIDYNDTCIRFSNVVKNLGVLFDNGMTFSDQVKSCVSSTFAIIKNISRLKSFLTRKEKCTLVCSLILSKLDYCNSLYYNIDCDLLSKLQYAQNCAARLIYNRRKYDHVKDIFKDLHWLPIKSRIIYKILLMVHKCLYHTSPDDLNQLITFESVRTFNLTVSRCNSSFGDRAFSVYTAKLWNPLPLHLKRETSIMHFKKLLKTYLFELSYY